MNLKLLGALLIVFYMGKVQSKEDEENKKTVECYKCESARDNNSPCRHGGVLPETCRGEMCYSTVYVEHLKSFIGTDIIKGWWWRGCTSDKNACSGANLQGCNTCTEDKCNSAALPQFKSHM